MSKVQNINFLGTHAGQGAARAQLQAPGDVAVDRRGVDRALVMRCPDGCGDTLTINLDSRSGKAWKLRSDCEHGLTLYPSVWRTEGCRAHFIIWRNRILWCGEDEDSTWTAVDIERAITRVLSSPAPRRFMGAEEIADQIDASAWDVVWVCRAMRRAGKLEEGRNNLFRLKEGI